MTPLERVLAETRRGHLERADHTHIEGWAHDEFQPTLPVLLHVMVNDVRIGEVLADGYRADLAAAGIGDGHRAFSFPLPGGLTTAQLHIIDVRRASDGRSLHGSPCTLGARSAVVALQESRPAAWKGYLDSVSRERIMGWAWDERTPHDPLALVILDNGSVIARVLANRYRDDLASAGVGDGRHAFATLIPGGLSPLTRHVIQVLGEVDGGEVLGSPHVIEAATAFDPPLERAVSGAVAALAQVADCERVLAFLTAETERLLQTRADLMSGREARQVRLEFQRRWGRAAPADTATVAAPERRALVIDDRVPEIGRDAGSAAILSHMRALQSLGYAVSFVAAAELSPPAASPVLNALGIEHCRTPYYASVEEILRRQHDTFDLIYLHRIGTAVNYLALARAYCRHARIVFSVADLHHLRVARQAEVEERPELLAYSGQLRAAEIVAARSAHTVLTHSSTEAAWLNEAASGSNVHVVPWSVPARPTRRPWQDRRGVAFIGNFAHAPNLDAAQYLIHEILPRVRRAAPEIECFIVGSHMPGSLEHQTEAGVHTLGQVADLDSVYEQVRLVIAPLRFGAGIKGKVLESFASGVPCVMSAIAAEGLELPETLATAVGTDALQLAALVVRLHADRGACDSLARAGLDFITAGYDEATVSARLAAALKERAPAAPSAPHPAASDRTDK